MASISVGIWQGHPVLDLDYAEDSVADTDMNVVVAADGDFIEIQGTAEGKPFNAGELSAIVWNWARGGARQLLDLQQQALNS